MKKIISVSALLIILSFFSQAQNQPIIDSLTYELKIAEHDSSKVKILSTLSKSLLKSEPDKSFEYANQLLSLAKKLNSNKYIITAYQRIAGFYYYKSDLKLAEEYSLKAIPIIEATKNKPFLSDAYGNLSSIARRRGDYSGAVSYSEKALKIAEELKDSSNMASIIGNRGEIYLSISDYNQALNHFFKALKISEAIKDKAGIADNYFSIGNVYWFQRNNDDKALSYFQLSLKAAEEANDRFQQASILQRIGETYWDKNELEKALEYFDKALVIDKSLGEENGINSCYRTIGRIYGEQGNFDEAIEFANLALRGSEKIDDQYGIGNAYGALGEIYLKKKNYKSAIDHFNKSLTIAKELDQKNNESENLMLLAQTYETTGNFKLANDYYKEHIALKDLIMNEQTMKKSAEMEARYNFEKSQKEIAILTKDKEIQQQKFSFLRNSFIAGIVIAFILLFLGYRIYHTRQLLKLQTIRNKIASDLHDDIGSTLSSISVFSLMARQNSKEVLPMLDQIGEYSRKMLDSMADIVWTINPENDNFEKIILRMRSFAFELLGAKNIDFEFNADESVNSLKLSMQARKNLYLIFKEATNNLVKYAEANSAMFSLSGSKNTLTLLIRDNGRGFDVATQTQGNGIKNMKNRAIEIGAKFLIESEIGKGTTIQLLMKTA